MAAKNSFKSQIKGKRYLVEAGKDADTVVRLVCLKTPYFPIVESRIYRTHIPYLHRGHLTLPKTNNALALFYKPTHLMPRSWMWLPMWLFDKTKTKNKQQLRDWNAGKMIEGQNLDANSIIPLTKPAIHQFSQGIMQELETNAQKALATPEIQQGIMFAQKRAATEIAEAASGVDSRYSLTASLFGLAEVNAAYNNTHDLILSGANQGDTWIAVTSLIDLCNVINSIPDVRTRQ
jgi:hypothetical protein